MIQSEKKGFRLDWITIILFMLLVVFGWFNILSASHQGEITNYFDLDQPYGKQAVFILLTIGLIVLTLAIEAKFYERFASIIYFVSILSLVGLFIFGKNVNGATSWYAIGGMTFQPSEFAKFATSLAVAKYISDLQTNIKTLKDQLRCIAIIVIPAILILLQNDAGSTIVYAAFFFVFYREGLQQIYLIIAAIILLLSVVTLKFGILITLILTAVIIFGMHFLKKRKRPMIIEAISVFLLCSALAFGVKYFYGNILKEHQQDRISLWLRL